MRAKSRAIGILMCGLALVIFWTAATAGKNSFAKAIDLNLANGKELQTPAGVGPAPAQRIIDMRAKGGRFDRVEDLPAIRGINQKKLDAMRPYVTVSAPPSASPSSPKGSPPAKK